jgi:hypothetical protein
MLGALVIGLLDNSEGYLPEAPVLRVLCSSTSCCQPSGLIGKRLFMADRTTLAADGGSSGSGAGVPP